MTLDNYYTSDEAYKRQCECHKKCLEKEEKRRLKEKEIAALKKAAMLGIETTY